MRKGPRRGGRGRSSRRARRRSRGDARTRSSWRRAPPAVQDLAVAGRPVPAASGAGAGGPHVGAPGHDEDLVPEENPGEAREADLGGRRAGCTSGPGLTGHRRRGRRASTPWHRRAPTRGHRDRPSRRCFLADVSRSIQLAFASTSPPMGKGAATLAASWRLGGDVTLELSPGTLFRRRIPGPISRAGEPDARLRLLRELGTSKQVPTWAALDSRVRRTARASSSSSVRRETRSRTARRSPTGYRDARRHLVGARADPNVARVRDVVIRRGDVLVVSEFVDAGVRWGEFATERRRSRRPCACSSTRSRGLF